MMPVPRTSVARHVQADVIKCERCHSARGGWTAARVARALRSCMSPPVGAASREDLGSAAAK